MTLRFGPDVPTMFVVVAVLFARIGSITDELTVAVPVIMVPFAVPLGIFTTNVKLAVLKPAILAFVHTALPVPPTPGVRQLHPAGGVSETNVELFGTGSTRVALSAALGPLFVTTTVYVMLPFAATGLGVPASVTAMSELEPTVAVSVAVSFRRFASPPPATVAVLTKVAGEDCDTRAFSVIDG